MNLIVQQNKSMLRILKQLTALTLMFESIDNMLSEMAPELHLRATLESKEAIKNSETIKAIDAELAKPD